MYIGAIPTPAATESRQEFTATANQTVFNTTGGTVGYCDCYLNGVKMANSDFSFDGADVTLTTGAAAGDVLAVVMRQADNALVALPITDSAGNNVLSESGGVVTLTADEANVGSNALVVNSSGNVGVGTESPTAKLHIQKDGDTVLLIKATNTGGGTDNEAILDLDSAIGGESEVRFKADGTETASINVFDTGNRWNFYALKEGMDFRFDTTPVGGTATERMNISSSGAITMPAVYSDTVTGRDLYISSSGQLGYVSSVRSSKTNIENLPSISWLYELTPVKFQYRTKNEDGNYTDEADSEIQYGFIAEDVVEVNSDLVFGDETENGFELRGIQYSRLIAPMIKAIQEQKTIIESQQSQIDALTARIEALETPA